MYIRGYNIYYRRENDTQEEMLFIEGNRNKQFLIGTTLVLVVPLVLSVFRVCVCVGAVAGVGVGVRGGVMEV